MLSKRWEELLRMMVDEKASDLHLGVDMPPYLRIDEKLVPVDREPLNSETVKEFAYSLLDEKQRKQFELEKELDMSFGIEGLSRFRANLFYQRGNIGISIRALPYHIMSVEECGLPPEAISDLLSKPKGLILVTGATGSGKSTTLASMIEKINRERACHIVTIEDPIEYVYRNKKSIIDQREVGYDTHSFAQALKHVLRQDPNVILIGEMRDLETIESALNIAETGHLVLSTLHTSDAVQTINRIIDVFPEYKQNQVRVQLSFVLLAVLSQQLIPRLGGKGRVLALELLIANHAVRSLIRDAKIHQIYSVIQTSQKEGMKTMNQSLYELYINKLIKLEDALSRTLDPDDLKRLLER
ncbi:MAG: type IV pilus twitching motility protein PilT [Candidatus Omnitrophica bacterium]|nr:type IV pilus twitching motility protein PilT [Candidatus Omnitrophota bacterium]MCM8793836.1 type IV pilus twitching motility protein PilT [Candidatus Omnitrophota bacterium]